jgi:hypothetical protein
MKPAFLLAACGLLLAPTLRAQSPHAPTPDEGRALAFHRAATLTDGINASGWFGGWGDYTPEHTSTWLTPADFKRMHDMGIRYVRFPLDPTLFARVAYTPGGEEALWKRLDDAIDEVTNAGLAVDLCVFPRDDYKQQLNTQAGVIKFAFLWQKLATTVSSSSSSTKARPRTASVGSASKAPSSPPSARSIPSTPSSPPAPTTEASAIS